MVYIIKNTKWHSQTGGNIDFVFSSRKKYPLSFIQELPCCHLGYFNQHNMTQLSLVMTPNTDSYVTCLSQSAFSDEFAESR